MSHNLSYEKDRNYHPDHMDLSERNHNQPGTNMTSYRVATSDGAPGIGPSYQPGRSYRHATGEAGIPEEPESPGDDTKYVNFKTEQIDDRELVKPSRSGFANGRTGLYIAIGLALLFLILAIAFLALWLTPSKELVQPTPEKIQQTTLPPTTTTPLIPDFGERVIGTTQIDGELVKAFTLNGSDVSVEIVSIGARVNVLKTGDTDVVLGFDTNSTTDFGNTAWGSILGNLCGGSGTDNPVSDPQRLASRNFKAERMAEGVKFTTTPPGAVISVEVFYQMEGNALKVTRRASATNEQITDLCSSINFNLNVTDVSSLQLMVPSSYVYETDSFSGVTGRNDFRQLVTLSNYINWYTEGNGKSIALTYKINGAGAMLHVATLRSSQINLEVWSSTRYATFIIPTDSATEVITGKGERQYGRLSFISVTTHAYPKASTKTVEKAEITVPAGQIYESINIYKFVK